MRFLALCWNVIFCSVFASMGSWVRIRSKPTLTLGYGVYDVTSDDK